MIPSSILAEEHDEGRFVVDLPLLSALVELKRVFAQKFSVWRRPSLHLLLG